MHIEFGHKPLSPVMKGGWWDLQSQTKIRYYNSLARQTPLPITPVVQELDLSCIWSSTQTTKIYKLDIPSWTAVKFQNVHTCESQFFLFCHQYSRPFPFYDHNFFSFLSPIFQTRPHPKEGKILLGAFIFPARRKGIFSGSKNLASCRRACLVCFPR